MSLEAKLELLTAAVIELTDAIGAMQAPGPMSGVDIDEAETAAIEARLAAKAEEANRRANPKGGEHQSMEEARTASAPAAAKKEAAKSSGTTSGEQSQPTGESSSPELDYAKDVKPITIRLSKEKGREITISVLQKFDVQSAQQLAPGQWASYIATCEKVLAGGEV